MWKRNTKSFITRNRIWKIRRRAKIKSIWSSLKKLSTRNRDWSRRNPRKFWISASAIPFEICACRNCCAKLQRSQFICWLIKKSMFSLYWSEFNWFSIKVNFLIAPRTWDENSIDFFFFLDIRNCVTACSKQKPERRLRKREKMLSIWRSLSLCRLNFISAEIFAGLWNFCFDFF